MGRAIAGIVAKTSAWKEKSENSFNYNKQYLRERIKEYLVEQDDAIERIIPYVTLYGSGLCAPNKPVATFLLLGPTGVGKSLSVEALARVLHGDPTCFVRIDCGEYQQSHEVAKLIGAPPGYLGHGQTKPLIDQVKLQLATSKNCSISLLLFDEIEKAHENLKNLLLGVLDKSTLNLGDNSKVNFDNTIIFFTSNLSAKKMTDILYPSIGFRSPEVRQVTDYKEQINKAGLVGVRKHFSAEFINRLDEIITYLPLSKEAVREIFNISFRNVRDRLENKLKDQGIFLILSDDAKEFLISKGFSELYGAREMNRTIQKQLVNPLANLLVDMDIKPGSLIKGNVVNGELILDVVDISKEAIV